ncbi:MAG: DivIVA domain-containing protein [Clostridia bacterium]|nr:DivIVA domain-containing protein [Clostridia bacterium]
MLNAAEIKNIRFSKSVGGYKQEEVEIFLDKVVADYAMFERTVKDFQQKIEEITKENEELKASQSSIQNVLLSAQRLADRIVNEAKEKSEEIIRNAEANISVITAREKELSATFELKAQDRKNALEKELADMVNNAKVKAESITAAAEDSVARQQLLYDKLKMEIAAFKAGVTAKYKEHLEILSTIPDSVPMDPKRMAEVVATTLEKEPKAEEFIKPTTSAEKEASSQKNFFDEPKEEKDFGFKVENTDASDDEWED